MTEKISVLGASQRAQVFGSFEWNEGKGGSIRIDQQWIAKNIVSCCLVKANGKGGDVVTSCHRLAKKPLEAAFQALADSGQWRLIETFDGLWVPRHMTWNPARGLSSHSWGIAFDLNAASNPYNGGTSAANRALNETFNRFGFAWGGDWNGARDSMHWELANLAKAERALQAPPVPTKPRLIVAVERPQGWSYHAIAGAQLNQGHFWVEPGIVAQALGVAPAVARPTMPSSVRLDATLGALGATILKRGDHLNDSADPRYYVFVKLAADPGTVVL